MDFGSKRSSSAALKVSEDELSLQEEAPEELMRLYFAALGFQISIFP